MRTAASVLDKLPKIETHEHDPIEAAERIIADNAEPAGDSSMHGSKAFYSTPQIGSRCRPEICLSQRRNTDQRFFTRQSTRPVTESDLRGKGLEKPPSLVPPSTPKKN